MSERNPAATWLVVVAMGSVFFIWGSTYLGIRYAIESMPPFLMAGGRFLIAGLALIAWQRALGAPWPTRIHWRSATIIGALMLLGGNGGVTWAESMDVPSSLAALMIASVSIWVVILNWLFFRGTRPSGRLAIGLGAGLFGVALLAGPADLLTGQEPVNPVGTTILLFAALSWAFGSLYSRQAELPANPLLGTGIEMLMGGVVLFVVGSAAGEWGQLDLGAVTARSWLAFAYLTVFGSLVAFTAYIWLLRNVPPARAASYAYVSPVVAMFLGWALANETITTRMLVAAAIIISSVVVITTYRDVQKPARSPELDLSPAASPAQSGK
ncbi:MAG: drug/metabolite exporter YedA [Chloroflexi bacterium]|nr:drug/metabolite exporter YedA [Chloroflexota bacterium]